MFDNEFELPDEFEDTVKHVCDELVARYWYANHVRIDSSAKMYVYSKYVDENGYAEAIESYSEEAQSIFNEFYYEAGPHIVYLKEKEPEISCLALDQKLTQHMKKWGSDNGYY